MSAAYNFTRSGGGGYSIKPSNRFTYVDGDGTLKDLYATVGDVARVKLSGDLDISPPISYTRGRFLGCSADEVTALITSTLDAGVIVQRAIQYLAGLTVGTPRYTVWFGVYVFDRKEAVRALYARIDACKMRTFTFVCTCRDPRYVGFVCECILQ